MILNRKNERIKCKQNKMYINIYKILFYRKYLQNSWTLFWSLWFHKDARDEKCTKDSNSTEEPKDWSRGEGLRFGRKVLGSQGIQINKYRIYMIDMFKWGKRAVFVQFYEYRFVVVISTNKKCYLQFCGPRVL